MQINNNTINDFATHVTDLMQTIGPVRAKRMFGGHGIFLDGLMFALIADGVLYLKTDEKTVDDFISRGLGAFTYISKNKTISLSYHQAPEEVFEDDEEMRLWAGKALKTALNAAAGKRTK